MLATMPPAAPCERIEYLSVPAAAAPRPKVQRKASVGVPRPRLTPIPRPVVKPKPTYRQIITRYDCPPPSSMPPGVPYIVPGVPYVGQPPPWGYPWGWVPTGPAPVWPGSPQDFPPGVTIPPAGTPPGSPPGDFQPPVDVPEPPTWSVILFGLALLVSRRFIR